MIGKTISFGATEELKALWSQCTSSISLALYILSKSNRHNTASDKAFTRATSLTQLLQQLVQCVLCCYQRSGQYALSAGLSFWIAAEAVYQECQCLLNHNSYFLSTTGSIMLTIQSHKSEMSVGRNLAPAKNAIKQDRKPSTSQRSGGGLVMPEGGTSSNADDRERTEVALKLCAAVFDCMSLVSPVPDQLFSNVIRAFNSRQHTAANSSPSSPPLLHSIGSSRNNRVGSSGVDGSTRAKQNVVESKSWKGTGSELRYSLAGLLFLVKSSIKGGGPEDR